jgi:hypothetical protein
MSCRLVLHVGAELDPRDEGQFVAQPPEGCLAGFVERLDDLLVGLQALRPACLPG